MGDSIRTAHDICVEYTTTADLTPGPQPVELSGWYPLKHGGVRKYWWSSGRLISGPAAPSWAVAERFDREYGRD